MTPGHAQSPQQLPTTKKFGWFLTVVMTIAATWAYSKLAGGWAFVWLSLALCSGLVTWQAPNLLMPLNRFWFWLGLMLGKIVSPVVLGAIYILVISPVALVTRWFGRDVLKLRKRQVDSYWVEKPPADAAADSFKHQY